MRREITIKMDYCADPIWENGANKDLTEYERIFSKELMSMLVIYRDTWEKISDNVYMGITDEYIKHEKSFNKFYNMLFVMQEECAKLCKKEQPTFKVILPKWNGNSYQYIEIQK